MQTHSTKQNRSQDVDVLSIQIIPDLAVTIEETTTVDIDIISSELEEGGGILEHLLKSIGLPIIRVVGELNRSLDVCSGGKR